MSQTFDLDSLTDDRSEPLLRVWVNVDHKSIMENVAWDNVEILVLDTFEKISETTERDIDSC